MQVGKLLFHHEYENRISKTPAPSPLSEVKSLVLCLFTFIVFINAKPIWTYGIQLWGTTSNSNIEILEQFQSEVLD
jgi:hypothetical protein